jgi:NADPH2:quinone reductase
LTAYGGGADDLPQHVLQGFLDSVASGSGSVPIDRVFEFEQLPEAHERMAAGAASGKMVVLTGM